MITDIARKVYENKIFMRDDGSICKIKKIIEYDDEGVIEEYFCFTVILDFLLSVDGFISFDLEFTFRPITDENKIPKDEKLYLSIIKNIFNAKVNN